MGRPSGCGPNMSGPASVVPYACAKTARGNAVLTSSMSFWVRGADPVFTNSTDERSVRASVSRSRTTIASIVGTDVSRVARKRPIAST